jgi:hypothetical protein
MLENGILLQRRSRHCFFPIYAKVFTADESLIETLLEIDRIGRERMLSCSGHMFMMVVSRLWTVEKD